MSNTRAISLRWQGQGLEFTGGGADPATPEIVVDGDGRSGPTPVHMLLLAAAACTASDVVLILGKMRVPLRSLTVDVSGPRRDSDPKHFTGIEFRFKLDGENIDPTKAQRAVDLSLEKYCSVVHSLRPDISVSAAVIVG
ncbi:MAG: OsmC family protein [Gemmatimonadales bacterium]